MLLVCTPIQISIHSPGGHNYITMMSCLHHNDVIINSHDLVKKLQGKEPQLNTLKRYNMQLKIT